MKKIILISILLLSGLLFFGCTDTYLIKKDVNAADLNALVKKLDTNIWTGWVLSKDDNTVLIDWNPNPTMTWSLGTPSYRWLNTYTSFLSADSIRTYTIVVDNDNNVLGNVHIDGNLSVKRPYGMFSSTTTQTALAANTPYDVNFDTVEDSYLIEKVNDINFKIYQPGDYKIDLSAIVEVDTPNKSIEIWVAKNGVNIPRSNTKVVIPSNATETLIVVPFIIDLNETDLFNVKWASNDAGSTLFYTAPTAYSPATPSIIMTMHKISEITD